MIEAVTLAIHFSQAQSARSVSACAGLVAASVPSFKALFPNGLNFQRLPWRDAEFDYNAPNGGGIHMTAGALTFTMRGPYTLREAKEAALTAAAASSEVLAQACIVGYSRLDVIMSQKIAPELYSEANAAVSLLMTPGAQKMASFAQQFMLIIDGNEHAQENALFTLECNFDLPMVLTTIDYQTHFLVEYLHMQMPTLRSHIERAIVFYGRQSNGIFGMWSAGTRRSRGDEG